MSLREKIPWLNKNTTLTTVEPEVFIHISDFPLLNSGFEIGDEIISSIIKADHFKMVLDRVSDFNIKRFYDGKGKLGSGGRAFLHEVTDRLQISYKWDYLGSYTIKNVTDLEPQKLLKAVAAATQDLFYYRAEAVYSPGTVRVSLNPFKDGLDAAYKRVVEEDQEFRGVLIIGIKLVGESLGLDYRPDQIEEFGEYLMGLKE